MSVHNGTIVNSFISRAMFLYAICAQDGTVRGAAQLSDGVQLFCIDFPAGAKGRPHQLKLTGMMDHTGE